MDSPLRRLVLTSSLTIGVAGLALAALMPLTGGVEIRGLGLKFAAHKPMVALLAGAISFTIRLLAGGGLPWHWLDVPIGAWSRIRGRYVAWLLAVVITGLGVTFTSRAAGGQDSYGYISEAELLLHGRLTIDQSFALEAPWPHPEWSFAPLAYVPWPADPHFIAPIYPVGYPLLLAGAKLIGGQDALFCVVPISAGLLVLATYGLGRRLRSETAGIIGAWFVATSPPVLLMMMNPMTDMPATAAWAAAFYLLLGRGWRFAAGAGVLAGLALMIRVNLAPLAVIMGLHYVLRLRDAAERREAIRDALVFSAALAPGILAVALINTHLYGSPIASGLGSASGLFKAANVWPNIQRYGRSLLGAHTPVVLAGLAAMLVPLRWFWPEVRDRRVFVVMAVYVLFLWVMYCGYAILEEWWYLRYLLPSWPFMMLGVGAVVVALARALPRRVAPVLACGVIALGLYQVQIAADRLVFVSGLGESRYVVAGRFAGQVTQPNSVVISGPHAGSIRYYGGRTTMRYDAIEPALFDREVEWLTTHGVHTYLAVESWELPEVRERFQGAQRLEALDRPVAIYAEPGRFLIFDLSEPPGAGTAPTMMTGFYEGRAAPPAPLAPLVFR